MTKILVVDDNDSNVKMLRMSLSRMGHTIITASSGEEAISQFRTEQPDLILMDVMMSGMNGFETTKIILDSVQDRWMPIIFLSAAATEEHFVQGFEAGGFDYLFKPINQKVLKLKIDNVIKILQFQNNLLEENKQLKQQLSGQAGLST